MLVTAAVVIQIILNANSGSDTPIIAQLIFK
jgi:hypothetical protein